MKFGTLFSTALFALGLSSAASAQMEVRVPQDFTSIQAAIDAVSTGGTVRITDSGTYREALTWNKEVHVVADFGAAPVITGTPATASYIVRPGSGSGGSTFGSIGGGQIILDGEDKDYQDTSSFFFIQPYNRFPDAVTFENIKMINFGSKAYGFYPRYDGHTTLRIADIDATGGYIAIRGHYGTAQTQWNYERVSVRGGENYVVNFSGGAGSMNFDTCEFFSSSTGRNPLWIQGAAAGASVSMTNCWLRGSEVSSSYGAGIVMRAPGTSLSLDRCAVLSSNYHTIFTWASETSNCALSVNHSDLIAPEGFNAIHINASTDRTFTVANSILYSAGNANGIVIGSHDVGSDTYNVHHTAYFGGGTGFEPAITLGAGTITGQDPLYESIAGMDLRYANATLAAASDAGGPVGSNRLFADAVPVELSAFTVN